MKDAIFVHTEETHDMTEAELREDVTKIIETTPEFQEADLARMKMT